MAFSQSWTSAAVRQPRHADAVAAETTLVGVARFPFKEKTRAPRALSNWKDLSAPFSAASRTASNATSTPFFTFVHSHKSNDTAFSVGRKLTEAPYASPF